MHPKTHASHGPDSGGWVTSTTVSDLPKTPLGAAAGSAVERRCVQGWLFPEWEEKERAGRNDRRGAGGKRQCANHEGYSLHAGVSVPARDRERLEKLCRYVLRPPLAMSRLSVVGMDADGDGESGRERVLYEFKRPFWDGSTHVALDPLTFLSRLAALVPPPRMHLVTYHGVLAPAAADRERIVPFALPRTRCGRARNESEAASGPGSAATATASPWVERRYAWAELMRRVFAVDVLQCENCGGRRRVLDFVLLRSAIDAILAHLGLPTERPVVTPARAPPGTEGRDAGIDADEPGVEPGEAQDDVDFAE